MELEKYLDIKDEVKEALEEGRPVVALESTILNDLPAHQSFATV